MLAIDPEGPPWAPCEKILAQRHSYSICCADNAHHRIIDIDIERTQPHLGAYDVFNIAKEPRYDIEEMAHAG